ncbi:MAG TPA: phosphatase PAP2 family protein, partial [Solirubrobacteraceae bacterium]|nr:phosphatase PAP2 family protein [Solirubrobacteraceae bacterium]
FLCYFAWAEFAPSWWRRLFIAVTLASIVLMGPARIAAGEHWPSDVLGGYLVATLWTALALAVLRAAERRWPTGRPI